MKLTQRNASKLYDGLCVLLSIDSLFIDHNGILHTNYEDEYKDEYLCSSSSPDSFILNLNYMVLRFGKNMRISLHGASMT